MYPLGVLFGLGFDTSSEIALLGISSIQAARGTSIWLILIFPILFTAGMCLLDTTDGALMMSLYTSTALARDTIAILYYSIVLTVITVVVALVIGVIQLLTLVLNVAEPTGRFWDGVERAGDNYEIIGELFRPVLLSLKLRFDLFALGQSGADIDPRLKVVPSAAPSSSSALSASSSTNRGADALTRSVRGTKLCSRMTTKNRRLLQPCPGILTVLVAGARPMAPSISRQMKNSSRNSSRARARNLAIKSRHEKWENGRR